MIIVTIEGPPVAKGRAKLRRHANFVQSYTPAKTRHYEDRIRCEAVAAMGGREPLNEAVAVTVTAYRPIPKAMPKRDRQNACDGILKPTTKPDLDNNAKCALDALNGIVFRDDSLVTDLIVRKRYSERPRLVITVEPEGEFA